MAKKRKLPRSEFKPDRDPLLWLKTLRLTQLQRLRLLRWATYVVLIVAALVIQDVIMSQIRFLGATTELAVAVILLITVIEGSEVGSIFVLIASTLYYFSGTAPNAYSVGLMCFPGITASLLRQMYWHRSRGTIVGFAGLAGMVYEVGLYIVGIAQGLTRWDTLPVFLMAGVYNFLIMIPLYPLVCKIGMIGGNPWKE